MRNDPHFLLLCESIDKSTADIRRIESEIREIVIVSLEVIALSRAAMMEADRLLETRYKRSSTLGRQRDGRPPPITASLDS